MKSSELQGRSQAELTQLEQNLSREMWRAQFDNMRHQLNDTSKLGKLRRDRARVLTALSALRGVEGSK